jgi:hypothetical protein
MRFTGLMASGGIAALTLASCAPPHPHPRPPLHAVSTLNCPASQGELNRQSAAPDGRSCVYATGEGDQVTLQLIALNGGDLKAALAPIEVQLRTEIPATVGDTPSAPPPPPPPGAPTPPHKDRVDIDLPGVHIHTSGDGHANIDAGGTHVEANGDDHDHGRADIHVGGDGTGVNVNADDSGAQVRVNEKGSGLRARYILASDTPGPHGFKAGGYEARGPLGGPVAVAVILTKTGDDNDDLRHDVHELIRLNVGG